MIAVLNHITLPGLPATVSPRTPVAHPVNVKTVPNKISLTVFGKDIEVP
jgi:hypothetical protein